MIRVLKKINIEFYLILFLFSGMLKDLIFSLFGTTYPIPLTILFGALFIIMIFVKKELSLSKIKSEFKQYVFFILFFIWALISIIYSSSENYCWYKIIALGTNYIAFIGVLLTNKINIKKFVTYFFSMLLFFFFIFFLINPNSFTADFIYHDFFNEKHIQGWYLILGQFLTANMLLVFIYNNKTTTVYSLLISFNIILLLGGRAPIIVAAIILICIILYLLISKVFSKDLLLIIMKPLAVIIIVNGLLFSFSSTYIDLMSRTAYRFKVLSVPFDSEGNNKYLDRIENDNKSVSTRYEQYVFSKEKIFKNAKSITIGYGLGSFSNEYEKEDKRLYPHNIVLEIIFELGFIGLFLALSFLLININRYKKIFANFTLLAVVILFLHTMKSSSFVDLRILFALYAISIFHNSNPKKVESANNNNSI